MDTAIESRPIIALDAVISSQLEAIGYAPETNTLAIQFKAKADGSPGSIYHYSQFTPDDFAAFKAAESPGKHFYKNIKPFDDKYPYVKVS